MLSWHSASSIRFRSTEAINVDPKNTNNNKIQIVINNNNNINNKIAMVVESSIKGTTKNMESQSQVASHIDIHVTLEVSYP